MNLATVAQTNWICVGDQACIWSVWSAVATFAHTPPKQEVLAVLLCFHSRFNSGIRQIFGCHHGVHFHFNSQEPKLDVSDPGSPAGQTHSSLGPPGPEATVLSAGITAKLDSLIGFIFLVWVGLIQMAP
ncbi:hypothetical protein AMECASPLE_018563 [Ameca splendens]|uniref:Uncharacterized protein n=1 Tax=Ameca splendens TaxID=208324 RepID=A0ABV0Z0V9_9TELE